MKIKSLITLFLISTFFFAKAQMNDLAKIMGDKKLISWNNIYNSDDSLYGMILFYKGDKIDRKHRRYEYLIIDKNLNLIAKNEFPLRSFFLTKNRFHASRNIDNKILLYIEFLPIIDDENYVLYRTYRTVDLSKNTISKDFVFKDGKIQFNNVWKPKAARKNDMNKTNNLIPIKIDSISGYLAIEYFTSSDDFQKNKISFIDYNNNQHWKFIYNKNATKKSYQKPDKIYLKDNIAIIEFDNYKRNKYLGSTLSGINLTNGHKIFEYQLENEKSKYWHSVKAIKKYDDKIYFTGSYYQYGYKKGIYKIALNMSGNELSKKYVSWKAFDKFLKISKNGKVENGYRLRDRDYFIFKDGSISYLSEKFKPEKEILDIKIAPKTTDMVLMNMDPEFNIKDAIIIQKAKSKHNLDYLFSQYIKNDTGCVFFFQNFKKDKIKKDKVGILGINTYINSKYSYEEVPIFSKKEKYSIRPIPSKEGYILLREFNKEEKFDQLRLEKINY